MSLLLEALKKAELAKQGAQSSRLEPTIAQEPTITRASLPDISQPVDFLSTGLDKDPATSNRPLSRSPSEMLASETGAAQLEESLDRPIAATVEPIRVEANAPDLGTAPDVFQSTPEQKAAKQMFEAKEVDYNPRRPFYITISVLVLCGAGYGGYVWWQMQPRSIYNAAAAKAQQSKVAERSASAPETNSATTPAPASAIQANDPPPPQNNAAVQSPQPQPVATAASAPRSSQTVTTGQQPLPPARSPEGRAPAAAPGPGAAATTGTPPVAAPRRQPPASPGEGPSISIAQQAPVLDPMIEQAYASFQKGDFGNARELYQTALKKDASSRDALLGLAALDMRGREFALAEARYLRLLENDPRDSDALAGLIALRGQVDPIQSESRLKTLIAAQPEASQLHFALGNLLAAQRRWNEAQAAYFKAYSLEPESPDFAFNLAVSLDQMRQIKPALEYYRRALALAGSRSAGFDKVVAANRISELSRP